MSGDIVLPYRYIPREYQRPFWRYMESGGRRYCGVWHRRAGKDHTVFSWITKAAFQRVGLYWHMLPTYESGRKVIWNGITGDGTRFVDLFPKGLVKRFRDDIMLIELTNGSIYQVVGGDDPDRLRGPNPVGVVFSEYAFFPSSGAWDVIRPILNENQGWAAFISTPQGRNHFYDIYQSAQKMDGWFSEIHTVESTKRPDGSPVVTPALIEEDRLSGMSEAMIQQEYYCSFDSPFEGSIFGDQMRKIVAAGGITEVPYRPDLPVETWWDLGLNDPTAIWFVQRVAPRAINVIKYWQGSDKGLDQWVTEVLNQPYRYSRHIGPWDVGHRDKFTAKPLQEQMLEYGLRMEQGDKDKDNAGVNITRRFLTNFSVRFDELICRRGIDALMQYRWEKDKIGMPMKKTNHDLSSHGAEAFRVGAVMFDRFSDDTVKHRQVTADSSYSIFGGDGRRGGTRVGQQAYGE